MRISDFPHRFRSLIGAASLLLLLLPCAACAATEPPRDPAALSDTQVQALKRAADAVVALRVAATEGATSAESLGARRTGSGVVIGADGLILTIGYLLLEAETIEITTPDDRTLPARQVAYDLATGFGLVRPLVPLRGVAPVPLADTGALAIGDALMVAIGGGSGTEVGFTRLVSKRPFSGYWEYHIDEALFTSPPVVNHSGAALFDRHGALVGIGSLFVMEAGGEAERALPGNMFVPVELLRPVLAEMQANGRTRASIRPWLGVSSSERGGHVEIVRVDRRGPALAAGLHPGDVVLEVDGIQVSTLEAFYKRLWALPSPDAEVELTVQQGSEIRKIRLHTIDRMQTLRKPAGI